MLKMMVDELQEKQRVIHNRKINKKYRMIKFFGKVAIHGTIFFVKFVIKHPCNHKNFSHNNLEQSAVGLGPQHKITTFWS